MAGVAGIGKGGLMATVSIKIVRGNKEKQFTVEYQVPQRCETVLEALQYVQRHHDASLAFSYDCRLKRCGLCAVSIDGNSVLACTTKLSQGMEVAPLPGLPMERDLVVDRSVLDQLTSKLQLHVVPERVGKEPPNCQVDADYFHLAQCNECLVCAAVCPAGDGGIFGPFVWVRLAQLHLDPRDTVDRVGQAESLGINGCSGCGKCSCASGINFKKALEILKKSS